MRLLASVLAFAVSMALLVTLVSTPVNAEPNGFGRALIFRICGDFTREDAFCVCNSRLNNVPEKATKAEFQDGVCKGSIVQEKPADLSPPNFPSMGPRNVIEFLFRTIYGDGIMQRFCPYDQPCDTPTRLPWTPETWIGGTRPSQISAISVIAAVYGQAECVKAQADTGSAKWVADLKALLPEQQRSAFDAELREMANSKGMFGDHELTIIEAGCSIDPWRIYQQVKQ